MRILEWRWKPPQSLQNEDIHFDQVEHRRLVSILDSLTSSLKPQFFPSLRLRVFARAFPSFSAFRFAFVDFALRWFRRLYPVSLTCGLGCRFTCLSESVCRP